MVALGSWRAWGTAHVTPPSQWPGLSLERSAGLSPRELAFKKKTPTWFMKDLGKILSQKP